MLRKERRNCSECCETQDFNKQTTQLSHIHGLPYDYCSLMHYGNVDGTAYAGCYVIPKENVDCNIKGQHFDNVGQIAGLSRWDKETIRRRYSCRG